MDTAPRVTEVRQLAVDTLPRVTEVRQLAVDTMPRVTLNASVTELAINNLPGTATERVAEGSRAAAATLAPPRCSPSP